MEAVVFAVAVKYRMLHCAEKFNDIVVSYTQYTLGKLIENTFVHLLGIKLLPASAEHYF